MNTVCASTIEFARKQGYIRGLRTAIQFINVQLSTERRWLRNTKKPEDMDIHAEHEHAIKVLKSVQVEMNLEVGKVRNHVQRG